MTLITLSIACCMPITSLKNLVEQMQNMKVFSLGVYIIEASEEYVNRLKNTQIPFFCDFF